MSDSPRVAVLGPGGVGGVLAGALDRAGTPTTVVARESTAELIAERGQTVHSVLLGDFVAHPAVTAQLREPVDLLVVATKAVGLPQALERVHVDPPIVLPLLNGLDHLAVLRERFPTSPGAPARVLAGAIRIEADRPEPGVAVHTSPFLLVDVASDDPSAGPSARAVVDVLEAAQVPARALASEAEVMWSKLVRLNALACTTSAFGMLLGPIRSTPELRAQLVGSIEEGAAAARAEGARDTAARAIADLDLAHETLGSSMARDIAAGREPELDAIPGAVLRAAARHGIPCPVIEGLVAMIVERTGLPAPRV